MQQVEVVEQPDVIPVCPYERLFPACHGERQAARVAVAVLARDVLVWALCVVCTRHVVVNKVGVGPTDADVPTSHQWHHRVEKCVLEINSRRVGCVRRERHPRVYARRVS